MSAHTARPGSRSRHPARPATLATAAAIALLADGEGAEGKRRGGRRRQPDRVLHRLRRAGLLPGPAAVRRYPQPGQELRHLVRPDRRRRRRPETRYHPADFSIVNQPGAASYPISGYSRAPVYTRQQIQATGQALVTMLDWLTHDGQAYAAANGYVPLPAQIRQLARTMLRQITSPTGMQLLN
jgi:hypothetical protein